MRQPLFDDLDLDPDLERLASDLARQLDAAGSTMDVSVPAFGSIERIGSTELGRRRRLRARPLVAAAVAVVVVGTGVLVARSAEDADLPVATGPEPSVPVTEPAPAPAPAEPVGWKVVLDPATGFHPTTAFDTSTIPEPDTSQEPGYRDGVLYSQHWVAVYSRPDDPLDGPVLMVETDYEPAGGVPGAAPKHPAPSFTIDTPRGPVPAWAWPAAPGVLRFGFLGDDEHLVTVSALGMSRDDAVATVAGITIGPKGAAEMPDPPGLVGMRVYERSSESAFTTYAEAGATGPFPREVHVSVTRSSAGPDLLEPAAKFFLGTGITPTSATEVERVTIDGRTALLRRYGDGDGALLITYDPDTQRTMSVYGQGGVGDDEILALAGQLRDVDDATWADLVDRCAGSATMMFTPC